MARAYPVLFSVAFVLSLFLDTGASPYSIARSLGVAILVPLLLAIAAYALTKDPDRAAAISLLGVIGILIGTSVPVLTVLVVAGVAVALMPPRRDRPVEAAVVSRALTTVAVLLLVVVVAGGVARGTVGRALADLVAERPILRPDPAPTAQPHAPDIYLVVLDSYARADHLERRFGYDNTAFLDALGDRGFDVSPGSRSNYLVTHQSLASMFSAAHLTDLGLPTGLRSADPRLRLVFRDVIASAAALERLRTEGYRLTFVASGYEDAALRHVDRFVDPGPLNEVEIVLADRTALLDWTTVLAPGAFVAAHRSRVEATIGLLGDPIVRRDDRPDLVVVHVPAPHPPFSLGRAADVAIPARQNLELRQDTQPMDAAAYAAAFPVQTQALNGMLLPALDRLLAEIDDRDVVVVLSDHGSRSTIRWGDLTAEEIDERSANLFAARTPEHAQLFGEDPTLVNVFPALFDAYLGGGLDRQPDTVYDWRDDRPLDLVPVEGLARP